MEPLVNNLLGISMILAVLWVAVVLVRRNLQGFNNLLDSSAGAEDMRRAAEREVIELHQRWDAARRDLEPLEPGQATERAVRLARQSLDELVDQVPTGAQHTTALSARASIKALEVMAAERRRSG